MPPTFDHTELLDRVDNDVAFLAETVQMLESDGPSLLAEIQTALASADAPAVGRSAHALKGMISNFCSPTTQESALVLERMGKSGDLSQAAPAMETLRRQLQALTAELVAFVKEKS